MNIGKTQTGFNFSERQIESRGRKFSIRNSKPVVYAGSKPPSKGGGSSGPRGGQGPSGPSQSELDAAAGLLALGGN